ncbi:MAG: YqeG family HAD IIIA-type phosphatase [Oscillospiraceae bacterium]
MFQLLLPTKSCESIFQIQGEALAAAGIKLLLADLDNTLAPYGQPVASPEVRAWKDALAQSGVTLFVLSNNRHENRPRIFSEDLGVPYIGHAGKPSPKSLYEAMERQGVTPAQTALIGDQIFTDVLCGNRGGVATILVEPLRLAGNPGRYLRYAAEWPFRAMAKNRKGLIRPV